jgi:hypothetical protein
MVMLVESPPSIRAKVVGLVADIGEGAVRSE